jgi:hypothetical protein
MFRPRIFPLVGLCAAVALAALPADAAQRGGRRGGGSGQRPAAPPPDTGRHAVPRPGGGGQPAGGAGRDVVVRTPGVGAAHYRPRYGYPGPVYGTYRPPVYGSFRGPTHGRFPGPIPASPYRYSHPYYTFRPRLGLGIGFHTGFAVPFPSFGYGGVYPYYGGAYGYPAPYPVPYPVPYPSPSPPTGYPASPSSGHPATGNPGQGQAPPPGGISMVPGTPTAEAVAYGGVSIEATPGDAEVWVNGGYAGRASDFGPQARPLTLATGVHRIELRAPGHRPLAFDVNVAAGYVVPFQGALQPQP